MSRHKLVKNLDLDNELDDYDGGDTYDYDGAVEAEVGMWFLKQIRMSQLGKLNAYKILVPKTKVCLFRIVKGLGSVC